MTSDGVPPAPAPGGRPAEGAPLAVRLDGPLAATCVACETTVAAFGPSTRVVAARLEAVCVPCRVRVEAVEQAWSDAAARLEGASPVRKWFDREHAQIEADLRGLDAQLAPVFAATQAAAAALTPAVDLVRTSIGRARAADAAAAARAAEALKIHAAARMHLVRADEVVAEVRAAAERLFRIAAGL